MVHLIEFGPARIALDVESGTVHRVDEPAFEILRRITQGEDEAAIAEDAGPEAAEILKEIAELRAQGLLFSESSLDPANLPFNAPVVKALCLLVSQDCNLRCTYCFAETGTYHGKRALMSAETARAALDFLVSSSGGRRHLEVDFFGGEPLLNFEVVKSTVAYGRELEKSTGKEFRFTLTTNAYRVDEEMIDFLNREMKNVVISIDGRREVHNRNRPNAAGAPTWDRVVRNARRIVEARGGKEYYVRGTYTAENLDFSRDVLAIADAGFDQISVEPVVAADGPMQIRPEHIGTIEKEYHRLAEESLKRTREGRGFNFFHFMVDLNSGPCLNRRLRGCGAGSEYLAVAANGDLYPCHQFAGLDGFRMGSVHGERLDPGLQELFRGTHVYSKEGCADCWAKYYCSGGCAASSYLANGDISVPYYVGCETERRRIATAIAMRVLEEETDDQDSKRQDT